MSKQIDLRSRKYQPLAVPFERLLCAFVAGCRFGLDVVDRLLCRAPMVVNDYLEFFVVPFACSFSSVSRKRERTQVRHKATTLKSIYNFIFGEVDCFFYRSSWNGLRIVLDSEQRLSLWKRNSSPESRWHDFSKCLFQMFAIKEQKINKMFPTMFQSSKFKQPTD